MNRYPFNTGTYFSVSNNVKEFDQKTCVGPNNFFKKCLEKNVIYGSEKPIKEDCVVITGTTDVPCNSLWNNLTRRKTLVEY